MTSRLSGIERRPVTLSSFLRYAPRPQAKDLFSEADWALKEHRVKRKSAELVAWSTDNGIIRLEVRPTERKSPHPLWKGHWPPGDETLTPPIVELFAAEQSGLQRALHESGDAFAKRVYDKLDRR